jgi:hypothetical protein
VGSNGDKIIKKGSYEATVKFIETLSLDRLRSYISSQGPITSMVITCLAALNAYINFNARQKYLSSGRGIYPPSPKNRPIILPGGVELKQGFYQSLRPGCGKLRFFFFKKIKLILFLFIINNDYYYKII